MPSAAEGAGPQELWTSELPSLSAILNCRELFSQDRCLCGQLGTPRTLVHRSPVEQRQEGAAVRGELVNLCYFVTVALGNQYSVA